MMLGSAAGGVIECEYSEITYGNRHGLRLAVAPFDATPSGPHGDYLYRGGGLTTPRESGVLATFAAVAALWAAYYPALWTLRLVRVWVNDAGAAAPLDALPSDSGVAGAFAGAFDPLSVVKRRIYLFSSLGTRWSVWLQQVPAAPVGLTLNASGFSGGYDARDQAWYAYLGSGASGLVGRDGGAFQPGGRVRDWWDRPMAPVVPYVYGG